MSQDLDSGADEVFSCIPLALNNPILVVPGLASWALSLFVASLFDGRAAIANLFTTPTLPFNLGQAASTQPMPHAVVGAGVADLETWVRLVVGLPLDTIAIGAVFIGAHEVLRGLPVSLLTIVRSAASRLGMLLLFYVYVLVAALLAGLVFFASMLMTGGLAGFLLIPALVCAAIGGFYGMLFVFPAIVIDGRNAQEAVVVSWRLAYTDPYRIAPMAITLVVISVVASAIRFLPYVGGICSLAVGLVLTVVQALVITKFYQALSSSSIPGTVLGP